MRLAKILLSTFFIVAFSFSARATIAIEAVVSNSVPSKCEGSFKVIANGTAGPFTVRLVSPVNGEPDILYNNIKVDLTIKDLCNGVYEVHVFPTRFPSCVTYLEAVLEATKDAKALTQSEGLKLEVSPNPTRGKVMVTVTAPEMEDKVKNNDWVVTVLDANGIVIEENSVGATAKSNRFSLPLDLTDYPRGVYYVRVRTPAGVEETGRVVVQ